MVKLAYPAQQESVIVANTGRLEHFGNIRHRIVHVHQRDARNNFDSATIFLTPGQVFPGSRPGKFLRARNGASNRRWLRILVSEFELLAGQIV
jgi:hypothetical protein